MTNKGFPFFNELFNGLSSLKESTESRRLELGILDKFIIFVIFFNSISRYMHRYVEIYQSHLQLPCLLIEVKTNIRNDCQFVCYSYVQT